MTTEKETTRKKSSALSGFKSLFVTEEETSTPSEDIYEAPKSKVEVKTSSIPLPETPSILSQNYSAQSSPSTSSVADQVEEIKKMRSALEASIETTSTTFDYPKYRKALVTMAAVVPDEVMRFKTAFITAQTMNVSKSDVVKSAQASLVTLAGEKAKFESEIQEAYTHDVVTLENDIKDIEEAILVKTEQAKKLNEEVAALNIKKNEVQANIFNTKKSIEATTMYFNAAHSGLTTEIQSDIDKMSKYLEG